MAKISIYPLDGDPKLSDKLIGTSVGYNETGELFNPTYNFSLQQLLDLFLPNIPANNLQGILDFGNTATQDINLFGKITTTELEVTDIANLFKAYISEELYIQGSLFDTLDSSGTLGQVLTSTEDGVEWVTLPPIFTPNLQQVLTIGNVADIDIILDAGIESNSLTSNTITSNNEFYIGGILYDWSDSAGVSGQILVSLGDKVEWQDFPLYTATSPLSIDPATKTISIQEANSTQNGYLSFTDWISFDGKQDALSGTGIVVSSGGTISYITNNSANWNTAYNNMIVSAAVTGDTTKTLTLNQQDGGTVTASWTDKGLDLELTTDGTSGPSTLVGSVLNIPDYTIDTSEFVHIFGDEFVYDIKKFFQTDDAVSQLRFDNSRAIGSQPSIYMANTEGSNSIFVTNQGLGTGIAISNTDEGYGQVITNDSIGIGLLVSNNGSGTSGLGGGIKIIGSSYAPSLIISNSAQGDSIFINSIGASAGIPINLQKDGVTNFQVSKLGDVTANKFIKSGGTSIQYLMADGTVSTGPVLTGYVPYTGATANVDLGTHTLLAKDLVINHTSGSGVAASITKNGSGEALTVVKGSGSGNAASILGGITLIDELYLNTDLSDAYISSAATWNAKQNAITLTTIGTSGAATLVGATLNIPQYADQFTGTVTSVAALTLGTGGTDLSSTVANPTTTPVITLNVPTASATNRGALSSSDWTTFNNKQAAGDYITSLTGEATASGPGAAAVTLNNASVTGKLLTGVNITGGTVLSTDTMLTAFGKLQNQINSLIGGSIYQGVWNANTNTPTLTSSVGTDGYYYIVNVAGSTNLNGITDWKIGDWAIFHGGTWQKVDNTESVSSVNGQTGAVSLTTDNISEGSTNLYFTDGRARAALSFTAGSGAYNSTTGVITIPTNTSQLTNGANYITLASLSGAAPIQYNNTTGAISITQAGASSNGFLSSTDWNTFNNKQAAGNYVTIDTTQTITGIKVFNDFRLQLAAAGTSQPTVFQNSNSISVGSGGYNTFGFNSNNDLFFNDGTSNVAVLSFSNTTARTYTLPDASGTLALTSNIPSVSGTTNYVSKFTGASALGNSQIFDNGAQVIIGGTTVPDSGLKTYVTNGTVGIGNYLSSTVGYLGTWTNHPFALAVNGSEKVRVDTSGNVGIGTTSPSDKLSVSGAIRLIRTDDSAQYCTIQSDSNGSFRAFAYRPYAGAGNYGDFRFVGGDSTGASATLMYINTNGNVGIGTTSPAVKLTIRAPHQTATATTFTGGLLIHDEPSGVSPHLGMGVAYNGGNQHSWIQSNNTDGTYVLALNPAGGNVLIGTTTDAGFKLDVNGSARSSTLNLGQVGLDISGYNFYSQTISGVMGILGHNVRASSTVANQVDVVNSGWYSSMIRQYYSEGITFHTSPTSYTAGSVYPMDTTERMRITSAGDVKIGTTTSTGAKLIVTGYTDFWNSANTLLRVQHDGTRSTIQSFTSGGVGVLALNSSGGNVLIGTTTDAGYKLDVNGWGRFKGQLISEQSNGTVRTSNADNAGMLHIRPNAGQSGYINFTENAVADRWSIGITAGDSNFYFRNPYPTSTALVSINTAGAITASGGFFNSDIRLKELIDYDYSVLDIKPISYLWKDLRDNKKHIGYSAQEVQKVMPDAVNEGEDGMLSVNYVEVLVAKIAELENRIKQLEK